MVYYITGPVPSDLHFPEYCLPGSRALFVLVFQLFNILPHQLNNNSGVTGFSAVHRPIRSLQIIIKHVLKLFAVFFDLFDNTLSAMP
jgi:hypothetical protein